MPGSTSIRIELGDWTSMHADAYPIRHEVFVREQNVPTEIELDEYDAVSIHAVAYDDQGNPIGTGRLLPDGHVGRMAVVRRMRGQGVGSKLLGALVSQGAKHGHDVLVLNAQIHARAFYEAHGFVAEGQEFKEAGIPHIAMRRVAK